MTQKVLSYIKMHNMLSDGSKVLVALSGGADSMCLINILLGLKSEYNIQLFAAHVEHGIRGKDSIEDAEFVKDYCLKNNIQLFMRKLDIPAMAKESKKGLEQVAREERYSFFKELCDKECFTAVATAHHGDDQAESVLLNLIRGAALSGISGMQPVNGIYIKPLLCVSKEEINEYCLVNKIEFRTDITNFDNAYSRNFIRNIILPELKKINPLLTESIFRNSELLRNDNDYLEKIAQQEFIKCAVIEENRINLDFKVLLQTDEVIRNRIYRKAARTLGVWQDLYYIHIELINELISEAKTGASLNLTHDLRAIIGYGYLIFEKQNIRESLTPVNICGAGSYELANGSTLIIEELSELPKDYISHPKDYEYADAEKLPLELLLRSRNDGDIIKPLGCGYKKLKKYFIDKKVERTKRDSIPLLALDNEIFYIGGMGISDRIKITPNTKKIIKIRYITRL